VDILLGVLGMAACMGVMMGGMVVLRRIRQRRADARSPRRNDKQGPGE
jgi:hypothetical protein